MNNNPVFHPAFIYSELAEVCEQGISFDLKRLIVIEEYGLKRIKYVNRLGIPMLSHEMSGSEIGLFIRDVKAYVFSQSTILEYENNEIILHKEGIQK